MHRNGIKPNSLQSLRTEKNDTKIENISICSAKRYVVLVRTNSKREATVHSPTKDAIKPCTKSLPHGIRKEWSRADKRNSLMVYPICGLRSVAAVCDRCIIYTITLSTDGGAASTKVCRSTDVYKDITEDVSK